MKATTILFIASILISGCSNPMGATDASNAITATSKSLNTLEDVKNFMSYFSYQPDSSYGIPTIKTIF